MNFDLSNSKDWKPLFPTGMLKTLQVENEEIKTYQDVELQYSPPIPDNHVRMKEKAVEKYLVEEF